MTIALTNVVSLFGGLLWLTGPIFDKELRVASRRRRSYALRCAYVVILCLFILYVWWSVSVRFGGATSASFTASRMGQAGRQMITAIIWFQFVTAQLMAIVMLSTAISGEIRQRTLDVLMTSPIGPLQIVVGKLLSSLLQVMLLLAISLPLLAIIRVFGGVPWDSIVSSLCITLTAVPFAGSISLFLSTAYRQAYTVVLTVMTGYLIVFGAGAVLVNMLSGFGILSGAIAEVLLYVLNTFVALLVALSPARTGAVVSSWPAHCAIMLLATAVVLSLAVWRVRKTALGRASGRTAKPNALLPIRRVTGAPVVWKEMRRALFGRGKARYILLAAIVLFASVAAVVALAGRRGPSIALCSYLLWGLGLIVFVRLAVLSAGSITAEKEGGTWPILLMTPLGDKEIVRGKAVAAFRRGLPVLLLLLVFYLVFYLGTVMFYGGGVVPAYFLYILIYVVSMAGTILFVIGIGLYLGVRMKSTNTAVASTVGIYIGAELFGRRLLTSVVYGLFLSRIYRQANNPGALLIWLVPIGMTFVPACIYAGLGLLAVRRATRRLRRDIF